MSRASQTSRKLRAASSLAINRSTRFVRLSGFGVEEKGLRPPPASECGRPDRAYTRRTKVRSSHSGAGRMWPLLPAGGEKVVDRGGRVARALRLCRRPWRPACRRSSSQARTLAISSAVSCFFGGMCGSASAASTWTSLLSSGLPTTAIGPSSLPFHKAAAESSRSPDFCSSGPWHLTQFRSRMACTSAERAG